MSSSLRSRTHRYLSCLASIRIEMPSTLRAGTARHPSWSRPTGLHSCVSGDILVFERSSIHVTPKPTVAAALYRSKMRASSSTARFRARKGTRGTCERASPRMCSRVRPHVVAASVSGSSVSEFDRVSILSEALPYLQKFAGKTVVVKYGGAAMKDPTLKAGVVSDVVLLALVGLRVVLVHGGGPEINTWLSRVGIEPNFKNGLRVTDGPTMEVVEMVLVGKVNKSIVSLINKAGGKAVGLCGKDGKLLRARKVTKPDIGFVGEVSSVDAGILDSLAGSGCIPVIASVAEDDAGQSLNINADTAAGEIAAALAAEKLILMTDVPGVMLDKDDISTLQRSLAISDTRRMVNEGIIAGGMIPKVECCVRSIAQGVKAAHIIDGRQKHSLLQEILTDAGVGTMITG